MINYEQLTVEELDLLIAEATEAKKAKKTVKTNWPVKRTIYFHRSKDDNHDLNLNFKKATGKSEYFEDNILHVGYDVGLDVLIHQDGAAFVVGICGLRIFDQYGYPLEIRI